MGSHLSPIQKLAALVHIGSYLAQPLMVGLLLLTLPLLGQPQMLQMPLAALLVVVLAAPLLYTVAQAALYHDWPRRIAYLPVLILVGAGIAWSTTRAVWQGGVRWGGVFARTPKFRIEGRRGDWSASRYRLAPDGTVIGEAALALYAAAGLAVAWSRGFYGAMPLLALYAAGFGLVAGLTLWQARGGLDSSRTSPP